MGFKIGKADVVNTLVKKYHYSQRPLPIGYIVLAVSWHTEGHGLFGNEGPAQAGALFSTPPSRWKEPVIELLRLVRVDNYNGPPLTQLVSYGLNELRRRSKWDLVVSFADSGHKHHGGIYQACSWNYHGEREGRLDGFFIGKRFIPCRTCNALYGTSSITKLKEMFKNKLTTITPHHDTPKYLYWKALNKMGKAKAVRLGLESHPYPKPNPKPNFEHKSESSNDNRSQGDSQ